MTPDVVTDPFEALSRGTRALQEVPQSNMSGWSMISWFQIVWKCSHPI